MPRDPPSSLSVMAMPPSLRTLLTLLSTSPDAAGDAARSLVVAVGDVNATSIRPLSTSSSMSPDTAGDATISPVVAVGDVDTTVDSAVVDDLVNGSQRGR